MKTLNLTSYYKQNYPLIFKDYHGQQFDTIACILPGQGAIQPGYLKTDIKKLPHIQSYLNQADLWYKNLYPEAKSSITDYAVNPEAIEEDKFHLVQNIFLLVVTCGFFEFLKSKGYEKFVLTSHSFGEYAAYVCADAIALQDMLSIVHQRELVSPKPFSLGGLIALNIEVSEFKKLQQTVEELRKCDIANINSDQQIVIAVHKDEVTTISKVLKKQRVAHRVLTAVAQAYHSHLMQESSLKFKEWLSLQKFNIKPLRYPVLSSVNQITYPVNYQFTAEELFDLFAKQLTNPVNFVEQFKILHQDHKIGSYLQFIDGSTYLDFIKNSKGYENPESIQLSSIDFFYKSNTGGLQKSQLDLEKLKNSSIFKKLSEHIESVTGFSVVEIEIMDQFQEDLRIDSIKKAEIVFKTLEDFNIHIEESLSLAQFKTIAEVVHYLDEVKHSSKNKKKKKFFNDVNNFMGCYKPVKLQKNIEKYPQYRDVSSKFLDISIFRIDRFLKTDTFKTGSEKSDVIVLDVTDLKDHFNEKPYTEQNFAQFFNYFQDLAIDLKTKASNTVGFKLVLCTEQDFMHFQAVNAFFKSLSKEMSVPYKVIEFNRSKNIFSEKLETIRHELNDVYATDIVYEDELRFVKTWSALELSEKKQAHHFTKIVIIGGAKGFMASQLAMLKMPHLHICLLGRSSGDDQEIQKFLKKNKSNFSTLEYISCDASKAENLSTVLNQIEDLWGGKPIDLIINAAGYEKSENLGNKDLSTAQNEFASKYMVSANLNNLKNKFKFRVLNYSSIVGSFGNEGQTVYSFANGYQMEQDDLSILWPAIDNVGMTLNKGLYEKMKATGIHFAKIDETTKLLQYVLSHYDDILNATNNILMTHPQDIFLFKSKSLDLVRLRTLAGLMTDIQDVSFSKEFHLQRDSFLNDHKIETSVVIPASYIVSLFLNIAGYYSESIKLEAFAIKNIILFTQQYLNCTCSSHLK